MLKLYWKEQEPHRNSALVGTLPLLELCPGWNSSLAGTLPHLELCLESAARALQFLQWERLPLFLQQEVHGYLESVARAIQFVQWVGLPFFLQEEV